MSKSRVLLVDDDPMIQHLIQVLLRNNFSGLDVRTCSTGFEACIQYTRFRPDLVVLDLQLPDVDGEDVLASMLKTEGVISKFLIVSRHEDRFDRMLELGRQACLSKPLVDQELLEKVASLLPEATPLGESVTEPE